MFSFAPEVPTLSVNLVVVPFRAHSPRNWPLNLPGRNGYRLIKPHEIKNKRQLVVASQFPGKMNRTVGIDFMINNTPYDELAVPIVTQLDAAEEWHISVPNSQHGGAEGHPFHIHVNDFEVISLGGIQQPPGTLQDTIWVPQNTEAVIRIRFKQWRANRSFIATSFLMRTPE